MKARGKVIDVSTKDELPKASVVITDKDGNIIQPKKNATSNSEGRFSIDVMPADYITISYIGYKNKTVPVKKLSSDINIIPLRYLKSQEVVISSFKGANGETTDTNKLENKPIKWYYWAALAFIGYYAYKKLLK